MTTSQIVRRDHPVVHMWLTSALVDADRIWKTIDDADETNALGILRQVVDAAVAASSADFDAWEQQNDLPDLPDHPRDFPDLRESVAWRRLLDASRVTSVAEAVAPLERWLRQSFAEQDRADDAAAAVLAAGGAELFRQRSFVVIRCKDCRAVPIAHIAVVDGRLLLWGRMQDGGDHYEWVEPTSAGPEVWCRKRAYGISFDEPFRRFLDAKRGKKRSTTRVSHSGHRGALRLH